MLILKGISNIRNQIKTTFFFLTLLTSNFAFAKMHEFETTHLKSTAGTGVAGILAEEAAFLNPASLAFYNTGSVFVQRDMLELKDSAGNVIQKPKNTGVVFADGNPTLSGALSYVDQEEGPYRRKRWGATLASPLSKNSTFGMTFRRSKDEDLAANTDATYYQTVFGITHAVNAQTSLGIVAYDAFNSKAKETKAIIGVQHIFVDYVTLAFDFGGNYTADEITDSLLYRGSLQLRILDDFYLRFGAFNDKAREETGNGYGLSWIQPRLALEFAIKNTKQSANLQQNRSESKMKETSFSVALRF